MIQQVPATQDPGEILTGRLGMPTERRAGVMWSYAHVRRAPVDLTLRVAQLTAVFCSLAAVVYAATDIEPSPIVVLFLAGAPVLGVILWLQKDAGRTGVGAVQDWGYFLLLAWPAVIPWYAFKTRGRAGWRFAVGLFALIWAPHISWMAVAYAMWVF